jgi:hypothetical protein
MVKGKGLGIFFGHFFDQQIRRGARVRLIPSSPNHPNLAWLLERRHPNVPCKLKPSQTKLNQGTNALPPHGTSSSDFNSGEACTGQKRKHQASSALLLAILWAG